MISTPGWCRSQFGEHLGCAIVKHVDGPVRFEIDQDGAVPTLLSTQREIVDAQYPRDVHLAIDHRVQQPQERVGADGYASCARQPCPALAASLQCKGLQQIVGNDSAACIAGQCIVETFGKDLSQAVDFVAEPTSSAYLQAHDRTTPGQIERSSLIAAVLAMT